MANDVYTANADGKCYGGRSSLPNFNLAQFSQSLSPNTFTQFPSPSLAQFDGSGNYPFDAPADSLPDGVAVLDWASIMDFDPQTQRWYFAGGRPKESAIAQKMIWYDCNLDAWQSVGNWSGWRGGHIYRSTCVAPEIRRAFYVAHGTDTESPQVWMWNIDTNTFAGGIPIPSRLLNGFSNGWGPVKCLSWFPTMGEQGSLIWINDIRDQMCRFDWATQQWTGIGNFDGAFDNNHLNAHYHPVVDAMIMGGNNAGDNEQLGVLRADGTTYKTAPAPCSVIPGGSSRGLFVPHPSLPISICMCESTSRIWHYNWISDEWTDEGAYNGNYSIAGVHPTLEILLLAKYASGGSSTTWVYKL